jgi:hypothetical protein
MITKKQDVEYLVSTPKNCLCPSLAEHVEAVRYAVVNDFLRQSTVYARAVW